MGTRLEPMGLHIFDFPAGEEHLSAADEPRFTPTKMR